MLPKARFLLAFSQLLTLFTITIFAESRENDSLALVALMDANQSSNLSWDVAEPLDSWEGVNLNAEGRVDELSLEFMSLTEIPSQVANLTVLKSLRLRYNKIEAIAPEIGNLKVLEVLNLSANKLESIPAELGGLHSLIELNLSNNLLTHLPAELCQLSALEGLFLTGNSALQEIPANIGNLSALKKIIVTKTAVKTIPESFGSLANLEYINFEENALESITEEISSVVPKSFDGKFLYVNFGSNFLFRDALPIPVIEWLDRYAGDWEGDQQAVSLDGSQDSYMFPDAVQCAISTGSLHLSHLPTDKFSYSLHTISGREVQKGAVDNNTIELSVSPGAYILRLHSASVNMVHKFTF